MLDLLGTFYDESVQSGERKRLLRACIVHLDRLAQAAGGGASVHPPAVPSQLAVDMLALLTSASSEIWLPSILPQPLTHPSLFLPLAVH